ncbi:MAG: KpsF/GutQ family sugar-phosphate isomerase [Synechococcus sp. WH 8007]|nr:KpsF/GutQ family sugar-phosphate isomerase [Synechococcus sp. WH 8007]
MSNRVAMLATAKRVLQLESEAIAAAVDRLDQRFAEAVQLILSCEGRVIVSGMGKSGLVGRKIAATFASLGTPSAFVHPADAMHGDLGMIRPQDLLLLLSHSGETEELLRLLVFANSQGNATVLISGAARSTMVRRCDVWLDGAVAQEACSYNLAPTSSTTLTMALGDALAVCCADERDFQPNDFARFHPLGSLGARLLRTVAEVMHPLPLPCCFETTPLREMIAVMTQGRFGVVLVMRDGDLVGIVTDGDLRRGFERGAGLDSLVSQLMTPDPITIEASAVVETARALMMRRKISVLPVSDGSGICGLVHILDL